jgi:hypothetical protein
MRVAVQFGTADMAHRGIHGMNQIEPRVNQRAIQIKHQQAEAARIERAQEANHGQFRINDSAWVSSQLSALSSSSQALIGLLEARKARHARQ